MKCFMIVAALAALTGCSPSPVIVRADSIVREDLNCDVSYPQLPRCECGCAGDICSTGSMGVVVCDSDQARVPVLLPVRSTALGD